MSADSSVLMLRAIKLRLEADLAENISIAKTYIEQGVGVGDHPELLKQALEAIRSAAEAEDCLRFMASEKFRCVLNNTTEVGKFFDKWKA
jgi:hypothetical protein